MIDSGKQLFGFVELFLLLNARYFTTYRHAPEAHIEEQFFEQVSGLGVGITKLVQTLILLSQEREGLVQSQRDAPHCIIREGGKVIICAAKGSDPQLQLITEFSGSLQL